MLKLEGRVFWEQHYNGKIPHSQQYSFLTFQTLPPSKLASPGGPLRGSGLSSRSTGAGLPEIGGMSNTFASDAQTQEPAEPARLREANVSDASAHTPPAGNISGLRQVERRAWDDGRRIGNLIGCGLRDYGT